MKPKATIINFKDLAGANRLDARFHIENRRLKSRAAELASQIPIDEARRRLNEVPLDVLQPAATIVSGQKGTVTADNRAALIREYPYLVLALVEEQTSQLVDKRLQSIKTQQSQIHQIQTLTEPNMG